MSIADTYRRIGLAPSAAQLACAKAILGEPLTDDEDEIAFACTGRRPSGTPPEEFDLLAGRSGKTEYVAAPILVHRAITDDDTPGTYLLVSPSKSDQARLGWQALSRQLERVPRPDRGREGIRGLDSPSQRERSEDRFREFPQPARAEVQSRRD